MKNLEDYHIIAYIVLILGLGLFFALFLLFRHSTHALLLISFGGSLFYILWGIIHHAVEKRLHRDVVIEYIMIGIFMFLLLSSVIIY